MSEGSNLAVDVRDVALPLARLKELRKDTEFGISEHDADDILKALEELIRIREIIKTAADIQKAKTLKEADPKIGMAIETHVLGGTPPTASEISDPRIGAAVEEHRRDPN